MGLVHVCSLKCHAASESRECAQGCELFYLFLHADLGYLHRHGTISHMLSQQYAKGFTVIITHKVYPRPNGQTEGIIAVGLEVPSHYIATVCVVHPVPVCKA